MFSPDGRWIAYVSNEAGSAGDVYVRPFPGPGGPWRISTDGGGFPRWSATARELLFIEPGHDHGRAVRRRRRLVPRRHAADLVADEHPGSWRPERRVRSASGRQAGRGRRGRRRGTASSQDKVVFFFNFGDYLKKIAPGNE